MPESVEQRCRDLLELCGIEDAQSMTAGDLCSLANELAKVERLQKQHKRALEKVDGVDYRVGHFRDNATPDELRDIVLGLALVNKRLDKRLATAHDEMKRTVDVLTERNADHLNEPEADRLNGYQILARVNDAIHRAFPSEAAADAAEGGE